MQAGANDFVFSADGRHLAYIAGQGGQQRVVVDGQAQTAYDEVPEYPLAFSPDGQHIAYQARKGNQWLVVEDGRESKPFDGILEGTPTFSPDSQRLAFAARTGGRQFVVVDGKPQTAYDKVLYFCAPRFTANSRHVWYVAQKGTKQILVVDGKQGRAYDVIGTPTWSANGNHVAYQAMLGNRNVLVRDEVEEPWPAGMFDPVTALRRNGKEIIAVARQTPSRIDLVVNGKPQGKGYAGLGAVVFSRDGSHIAYVAMTNDSRGLKFRIVVDGKEGPVYDFMGELIGPDVLGDPRPVFSPDARHLAYTARKGKTEKQYQWVVVVDGYEGPSCDGVAELTFSPDSQHLAYMAKRGKKWAVVVDRKAGPEFDAIEGWDPSGAVKRSRIDFSPDSQHVVYSANHASGPFANQWMVVLDGVSNGPFDYLGGPNFDAQGRLEYLAVKDGAIYKVTWLPKQ